MEIMGVCYLPPKQPDNRPRFRTPLQTNFQHKIHSSHSIVLPKMNYSRLISPGPKVKKISQSFLVQTLHFHYKSQDMQL